MTTFTHLRVPVPTAELKPITPYLQRAEEVLNQDPVVGYWCAYYAAQLGITIKAKDTHSRNLLLELLGALERIKKEIGPSDAIDMEAASAAYVENFALKVFNAADNEDRRGNTTKSTAKRFLAAANFLEVLKVFPKSDIAESNGEKIRYARWKAADIAKALREGRKPASGPAVEEDQTTPPAIPSVPQYASLSSTDGSILSPNMANSQLPEVPEIPPPSGLPPNIVRSSPPPQMSPADIARANRNFSPPDTPPILPAEKDVTPGTWSTAATPGAFSPSVSDVNTPAEPSRAPSRSIYTTVNDGSEDSSKLGVPSAPELTESNDSTLSLPPGFVPHPSQPSQTSGVISSSTITEAPELVLTPSLVAKAQKHCRFAISALDYEDANQARKELRAALALLGN